MTAAFENQIEKAQAELDRTREALGALQKNLAGSSYSVTDKNRTLTVTADSAGEVTEVKFLNRAYRTMAQAELGSLLVETIRAARAKAVSDLAEKFSGVLPAAAPIMQMVDGGLDVDEFLDASLAQLTDMLAFGDAGASEESGKTDA